MKKTIFALVALSSLALGDIIHGVDFTTDKPSSRGLDISKNWVLSSPYSWVTVNNFPENLKVSSCSGFYLEEGAGLRIVNSGYREDDISLKYLYLHSSIKINDNGNKEDAATTKATAGLINWETPNNNLDNVIYIQDEGWVDIDADYGNLINVSQMTSGAIYLNTAGHLDLTDRNNADAPYALVGDVNIFASFEEVALFGIDDFSRSSEGRTLIDGDLSQWTGTLTLTMGNSYAIYNSNGELLDAEGSLMDVEFDIKDSSNSKLFVKTADTPAVPEPTTATLSLLALAGLCARRRRR